LRDRSSSFRILTRAENRAGCYEDDVAYTSAICVETVEKEAAAKIDRSFDAASSVLSTKPTFSVREEESRTRMKNRGNAFRRINPGHRPLTIVTRSFVRSCENGKSLAAIGHDDVLLIKEHREA